MVERAPAPARPSRDRLMNSREVHYLYASRPKHRIHSAFASALSTLSTNFTSEMRSTKRHTQSADGSEHRSQQSRWFGLASEQRAGVQVQPEGVVVSLAFALELAHGAAIDARCPQDLAAAVIAFYREVACLRPASTSCTIWFTSYYRAFFNNTCQWHY